MPFNALNSNWAYLFHMLVWMLPIVALQWFAFHKILKRNWKALVSAPIIVGTYLIATDGVAIHYGIWFFDSNKILGIHILGIPLEGCIFFYLTALLVVQSFILFLPGNYRY